MESISLSLDKRLKPTNMQNQPEQPFTLKRPEPKQQPKPTQPEPVKQRQLSMFDAGRNDLRGQRYMFDEFEG